MSGAFEVFISLSFFGIIFWAAHRFAWLPTKNYLEGRGVELTLTRFFVFTGLLVVAFFLIFSSQLMMFLGFLLVGFVVWRALKKPEKTGAGHKRGGKIVATAELEKLARKEDQAAEIFIGSVGIPCTLETRHLLLAGATGSGKSQAFYQVAEVARRRGDAAVVADVNAEFFSRFYDPGRGDAILNPLDRRSENWSPLSEIFGVWDADRIAKSMVPVGEGSAQEWNHYAQTLLSAILAKIWQADGNNFDLTNLLLMASSEDLGEQLAGSQAAQLFSPGAERMLSSIRAILSSYCQPLSYLNPSVGRDGFSITKFVQAEAIAKRGAWLFFPVRDDFFKSFRSLIAAQIDISISALLSSADDEARRVWFFMDEFASWGRVGGVGDLLTKARKKGGVGALGLQSISQLRETYGREGSQTLLSNLGTWVTLRAGDAETADFMSRNIGDEQVRRMNESVNAAGEKSRSEQIAVERVVMPAELQSLPDLKGVLNIAGPLPAGWISVPISKLERRHQAFEIVPQ